MCYFVSQGVAATLLSPGESNCVLEFGPDHKTKKSPSRPSVLGHCTNARSSLCSNIIQYNTFLPPASVYCTECKPKTKSGQESLSLECTKYPCSDGGLAWPDPTRDTMQGACLCSDIHIPCIVIMGEKVLHTYKIHYLVYSLVIRDRMSSYSLSTVQKKKHFHHPTDIVRLSYIAT